MDNKPKKPRKVGARVATYVWQVIAVGAEGQGHGTCGHHHATKDEAVECAWAPAGWPGMEVCDLVVREVRAPSTPPAPPTPPRDKLHRIHAAPQATRVQFDGMGITWRGDGGCIEEKTAMARRLAVAWNVCEGFPTPALERGLLRELVDAVAAGNLAAAQAAVAEMDLEVDTTGGRVHDCEPCLAREAAQQRGAELLAAAGGES